VAHLGYYQGVVRVGRRNVWVSKAYLDRTTARYDAAMNSHRYGTHDRPSRVYTRKAKNS
jgi:hypothetical protein